MTGNSSKICNWYHSSGCVNCCSFAFPDHVLRQNCDLFREQSALQHLPMIESDFLIWKTTILDRFLCSQAEPSRAIPTTSSSNDKFVTKYLRHEFFGNFSFVKFIKHISAFPSVQISLDIDIFAALNSILCFEKDDILKIWLTLLTTWRIVRSVHSLFLPKSSNNLFSTTKWMLQKDLESNPAAAL